MNLPHSVSRGYGVPYLVRYIHHCLPTVMIPDKSASDKRDYRIISLSNGIKLLLASDMKNAFSNNVTDGYNRNTCVDETRLAACALCIGTGSFHDPDDVPGLAHFLEHMVFLGSEKFPEESSYDTYLNMHGGSCNASTSDETTVFQFDVLPEYFEGALDMFSQFFISPLLIENAVEREINAVDSEFKERFSDDDYRTVEVMCNFARKDHPYSKFTHGNKKSLLDMPKKNGVDLMGRLREFFLSQYCTKEITVSLCSPHSLDNLESLARKYFSGLSLRENEQSYQISKFDNPYELRQFNKLFYIVPIEEIHMLEMTWILPPQRKNYKNKPASYVSWLLEHQCKGSIYAFLKKKGYISSICAYCSTWSTFSMFHCILELTEKGLENLAEVVQAIFQYIHMIQKAGASEEIYSQIQQINKNSFKYQEPEDPLDFVQYSVFNMQYYEPEDYLRGNHLFSEFDSQLIEGIQNSLTLDSVSIKIISQKNRSCCHDIEPWFETKYAVKDIPSEWILTENFIDHNFEFHLPEMNRYIPDNFDLCNDVVLDNYPVELYNSAHGKLWYKLDKKFLLPKVEIYFKLIKPREERSYDKMSSDLLEYILDFELEELSYEAEVSSLYISQTVYEKGYEISVSGFKDKLLFLFKDFITLVSSHQFTLNAFNVSKEVMRRDYCNSLIKPDEFHSTLKQLVMRNAVWSPIDVLKELKLLTPEKFQAYFETYFSHIYVESLFQGNISQDEARDFQDFIFTSFKSKPLPFEKYPQIKTLCLPIGRTVCRHYGLHERDPNSVIQNYYQVGPASLYLCNVARILEHVMEDSLFDILRTQQQLGYTVYGNMEHSQGGILGYSITVHTEEGKFDADYVDAKIEKYFKTFYGKLEKGDIKYDEYVDSYIKLLKQADLCVGDEASRNWSEIYNEDYIFDRRYRSIEIAKRIEKCEILDFLDKYILDKTCVKMLSIQVIGYSSNDSESDSDVSSDSEDDSSSSSSSMSSISDEFSILSEDLLEMEINLIPLTSEQYDKVVTDIDEFKLECGFYPISKMLFD